MEKLNFFEFLLFNFALSNGQYSILKISVLLIDLNFSIENIPKKIFDLVFKEIGKNGTLSALTPYYDYGLKSKKFDLAKSNSVKDVGSLSDFINKKKYKAKIVISDEQDMRKMGGLWSKIKITYVFMCIGSLALLAVPPFAGYFSKDMILEVAYSAGTQFSSYAFLMGILAAFMTAFYMGRHWLLIFHKEPTNNIDDVHEAPKMMTRPLLLLGIFSIFIGFINTPFFHGLEKVLHYTLIDAEVTHLPEGIAVVILALISIGAGFTGLGLAYLIYIVDIFSYFKFDIPFLKEVKGLSSNVLYLNKVGHTLFVQIPKSLVRKVAVVIDGLVIDGFVNGVSSLFYKSSKTISVTQSGLVRNYVVYFGFFLLLLISIFIATPLIVL